MAREKNTPNGKRGSVRQLSDAELAERAKQARQEAVGHTATARSARQTLRQPSDSQSAVDAARSLVESRQLAHDAFGRAGAASAEIKRREKRQEQIRQQQDAHLASIQQAAQQARTAYDRRLIEQAERQLREQQTSSSQNGRKPDAQPAVPNVSPANQNGRRPGRQVRERTPEEEAALLKGVAHAVTGLYAHDVRRVPKRGEPVSAEEAERFAQIADGARGQLPPMRDGRLHGNEHAGRALAARAGRMIDHVVAGTATPDEQQTYNDVRALAEQSGQDIRRPQAAKYFVGGRMYNLFSQAAVAQKKRS